MQASSDFDWYAVDPQEIIVHFASGGGEIPSSVSVSKSNLEKMAHFVRSLPEFVSNFEINPGLENIIAFKSEQEKARYTQDFISMSQRGLYSFDKDDPGDFSNKGYHLVAKPGQLLRLASLPDEIAMILKMTRIKIPVVDIEKLSLDQII